MVSLIFKHTKYRVQYLVAYHCETLCSKKDLKRAKFNFCDDRPAGILIDQDLTNFYSWNLMSVPQTDDKFFYIA